MCTSLTSLGMLCLFAFDDAYWVSRFHVEDARRWGVEGVAGKTYELDYTAPKIRHPRERAHERDPSLSLPLLSRHESILARMTCAHGSKGQMSHQVLKLMGPSVGKEGPVA